MQNPAKFMIPIAGFLAIGLSVPATAAELDVNARLKNFINGNASARYGILRQGPRIHSGVMQAGDWTITDIRVSRMRALKITVTRPAGKYKVIAAKGVAICPDPIYGNPSTDVTQSIEFTKAVSNTIGVTRTSGIKTGVEASVEVGVEFGLGAKKSVKLGLKVNHEKSRSTANTQSKTTSETISEKSQVRLRAAGGKWATLWARLNQVKNVPYTAIFEPLDDDFVTFKIKNVGNVCVFEHSGYRGRKLCFSAGTEVPHLGRAYRGWNDRISSVTMTNKLWATFFRDSYYRGIQQNFSAPLGSIGGWNDRTSSIKVGGVMEFKLRYRDFKAYLPASQRQFKVSGIINVDMTQGTQTKMMVTPMKKTEYNEYCALSGGFSSSKKMLSTSGAAKKPQKGVTVRNVPVGMMKNIKPPRN